MDTSAARETQAVLPPRISLCFLSLLSCCDTLGDDGGNPPTTRRMNHSEDTSNISSFLCGIGNRV